jgi:hypothetical protein
MLGTVLSLSAPPTALFNGKTPLGMSNTDAMKLLRGPKHENWPVCDMCDPRAAPPGEYGLKSGENEDLARANGAIDGPYCSPTLSSVFGRRCEPLAGRGGGFGGWSCTSAHTRRVRALLQFEWLRKTRGVQAVRHCGGRPGRDGWATSAFPGGGQGGQSRCFSQPAGLLKCARRNP